MDNLISNKILIEYKFTEANGGINNIIDLFITNSKISVLEKGKEDYLDNHFDF